MSVHDFRMLDHLPYAVYVLGAGHDVLYVNRTFCDAWGTDGRGLVGEKCYDALDMFEWCHDPGRCLIQNALSSRQPVRNIPVRARFSGRGFREHLLSVSRCEDAGETFLLVCFVDPADGAEQGKRDDAEETARRLRELTAINRITSRIARAQDLPEVLRLTLGEVIRVLGGNKGVIYLREGDRFVAREKQGVSDGFAAHPKISSRDVREWGARPVICDVASAKSRAEGIYSWISVPLVASGRPTGLIIVTSGRERHFSQAQIRFLETIANDVGMAVANAELLEKVRQLSVRDPLTGLFNRLRFEEKVKELADGDQPVSVLMIDLDGLKLVNDTLGHARGDEMLKAAAGVISRACREGDFAARLGGDEFAVVLPGTDGQTAARVSAAILQGMEEFNRAGADVQLSFSVGCATAGPMPLEAAVRAADAAMYRNKLGKTLQRRSSLLNTLNAVLAEKGRLSNAHGERLSRLARAFAAAAGLPPQDERDLELLAVAHDVGKVGVPDYVFLKPGPLTAEERSLMEKHCEIGHRIAKGAAELDSIARFILHHHERWDGQGYPDGLTGEEIPRVCRLLAIIDAFEAMTSDRPYRRAMTQEEALAELRRCRGTQFDPVMVDVFLNEVIPVLDGRDRA